MFDLNGKVALITGGASGIGKAISLLFAHQGAEVHIIDIKPGNTQDVLDEVAQKDGKAFFHPCDVSQQEEVAAVMDQVYHQSGKIDVLVNNAGVSHIGTVENTTESDFDRIFSINVKGVYNCAHCVIPYMKKHGNGCIINMGSVAATVGLPDRFAYSMSKGAVLTMTYCMARDLLPYHIRVNSIAPARVHTPFVDDFISRNYPGKEKEMFDQLSKTQPIGRMGKPDEIAGLALYLASDEASFITGTDFPIDGGSIKINT